MPLKLSRPSRNIWTILDRKSFVCKWIGCYLPVEFSSSRMKGDSCPRRISPDSYPSRTTTFTSRWTSIENFHSNFARSNFARLLFIPLSLAVDINISGIRWFVLIELHNDSFSWNWLHSVVVPADRMGAKRKLLHAEANGQSAESQHSAFIRSKRIGWRSCSQKCLWFCTFKCGNNNSSSENSLQSPTDATVGGHWCLDTWWTLNGDRMPTARRTQCTHTGGHSCGLRARSVTRPVTVSVKIALANGTYTHICDI